MRIAAKGKYWIQVTNIENGKKFLPFYDGFTSFKEASAVCEKFRDSVTSCKYMYEVISR